MLNGYRIGTYLAERLAQHDHPAGFLEVGASDVDLKVSTHLRLGDFLTHDGQDDVWPKYVALNPRLLDKLELVLAKIGAQRAGFIAAGDRRRKWHLTCTAVSVRRRTTTAFGAPRPTADTSTAMPPILAIDADGDGRVTLRTNCSSRARWTQVEEEHPDLVGGLGLYISATTIRRTSTSTRAARDRAGRADLEGETR